MTSGPIRPGSGKSRQGRSSAKDLAFTDEAWIETNDCTSYALSFGEWRIALETRVVPIDGGGEGLVAALVFVTSDGLAVSDVTEVSDVAVTIDRRREWSVAEIERIAGHLRAGMKGLDGAAKRRLIDLSPIDPTRTDRIRIPGGWSFRSDPKDIVDPVLALRIRSGRRARYVEVFDRLRIRRRHRNTGTSASTHPIHAVPAMFYDTWTMRRVAKTLGQRPWLMHVYRVEVASSVGEATYAKPEKHLGHRICRSLDLYWSDTLTDATDRMLDAIRLVEDLPASWLPRSTEDWRAACILSGLYSQSGRELFGSPKDALRHMRGDWSAIVAASGGSKDQRSFELRLRHARDAVRDVYDRIVEPAIVRSGDVKRRRLARHVVGMRVAREMVSSDAGLLEVLRRTDLWHARSATLSTPTGPVVLDWEPLAPDFTASDGTTISFLTDHAGLRDEGAAMSHCAASYAARCVARRAHVASAKARDGSRLATIEMSTRGGRAVVRQIVGPGNSEPPEQAIAAVEEWLASSRNAACVASSPPPSGGKQVHVWSDDAPSGPGDWRGIIQRRLVAGTWNDMRIEISAIASRIAEDLTAELRGPREGIAALDEVGAHRETTGRALTTLSEDGVQELFRGRTYP